MVEITDAYAKGKITEEHYSLLNGKISDCNNKQQKRQSDLILGIAR